MAGVNVRFYNLLVAVLAAVTVTVAMRTVGLLLVSALMVVPVATAQQLTRSFRSTLAGRWRSGWPRRVGGLVLAAYRSFDAQRRARPDDRAAGARRLRADLAVGAWLRSRERVRAPSPRSSRTATRSPTSTRTCMALTAVRSPSAR